MLDPIVVRRLNELNMSMDTHPDIWAHVRTVSEAQRFLDKAPARLVFKRAEETPIFGCEQEFIYTYNQLLGEATGDMYTLAFGQSKRIVDKEVFYVLQTLIRQSHHGIQERAEACFTFFRVIGTSPGETLTVHRCSEYVVNYNAQEYYEKELQKAILFCLSAGNTAVLYWTSICEFSGLYEQAYKDGQKVIEKMCKDEAAVNKFVKEYYSLSRKDEDFKKKAFTKGVSKALLAMVYYLLKQEGDSYLS